MKTTLILLAICLAFTLGYKTPDYVVQTPTKGAVVLDEVTKQLVDNSALSASNLNGYLASRLGLPWPGHSAVVDERAPACLAIWVSGVTAPSSAAKFDTPSYPLREGSENVNVADVAVQQGGFVSVGGDMTWSLMQMGPHPYFAKDNTNVRMSLRQLEVNADGMNYEYVEVGDSGIAVGVEDFKVLNSAVLGASFNADQGVLTIGNQEFSLSVPADAAFVAEVAYGLNLPKLLEADLKQHTSKVFIGVTFTAVEALIAKYGADADIVRVAEKTMLKLISQLAEEIDASFDGSIATATIFKNAIVHIESQVILDVVPEAHIPATLSTSSFELYLEEDVCATLKAYFPKYEVSCFYDELGHIVEERAFDFTFEQEFEVTNNGTNDDWKKVEEAQLAIWGAVILFFAVVAAIYMLVYMDIKKDTLIYGQDPLQQRDAY